MLSMWQNQRKRSAWLSSYGAFMCGFTDEITTSSDGDVCCGDSDDDVDHVAGEDNIVINWSSSHH